jgi:hypothetical protein
MTAFRFPIPTDIINELKKYSINSENDLLIFFVKNFKDDSNIKFGRYLSFNLKIRKMYYFHQLHMNNGDIPFLLNFQNKTQISFLRAGIFNEQNFKTYAETHCIHTIILKTNKMYPFAFDLIKNEKLSVDNFYCHFKTRTKHFLMRNDVFTMDDLHLFLKTCNYYKEFGLGKKGFQELQMVYKKNFNKRKKATV